MRSPDVVYHLAWMPPGRVDATSAGSCSAERVVGARGGQAAGREGGHRAACSCAVRRRCRLRDLPIKEGHAWNPVGLGGIIAKAVVDLLNLYRADHTVEFTALAMSNVYGSRQRADGGVVGSFAHALRSETSPQIHGDGRQTRDFLYVDDAVDALVRAGARGGGLVVNIGTGVSTSIRDLWNMMAGPGAPAPINVAAANQRHRQVRPVADTGTHPPGVGSVDRPERRPAITGLRRPAARRGRARRRLPGCSSPTE